MRLTMWLVAIMTTALLAFSSIPGMATDAQSKFESLKRFSQILDLVERYYVQDVPRTDLINGAINGMLQSLDPHSTFMDQEEYKSMQESTTGEFFGIGVEITQDESGVLRVVTPIEDTPADKAGLAAGDLILEVDGKLTQDLGLRESVARIKGEKGSKVKLTILSKKAKAPREVEIVRDSIPLVSAKVRELDDGIVWIRLSRFSENTTDELQEKLAAYKKKHKIKGVVLDLRNNPGGLLDQSIKVADLFLQGGTVVSIKGKGNDSRNFDAAKQAGDITAPMVVLINAGSASASEIVAGALRDHKRALIIGEPSFGKGSVQNIIPLNDGSAIKLTIARYFTPNGTSIQAKGIEPDLVVPFELPAEKENSTAKFLHAPREQDLEGHLEKVDAAKKKSNFKQNKAVRERLAKDNQLRLATGLVKTLPRIQSLQ
ncbi:S41 family peptidase [Halodesulfovibrio aestuarii]|uniref:C-terminal processing peptidase-3. Serine peptidase. MEROPS family S41A n=1 Tax=Halodesulfovibrio aestuarii TaxID=126333 RepID=A0A8G2FGH7_9BACT|nr:S41 family peptidase [Halodesulfovibrio aestuarii]SHI53719.1 C-terminal processing peptidase-3. Serine peptidase. MEROPS family S41A [Halodesulfovibrio aestuarii]